MIFILIIILLFLIGIYLNLILLNTKINNIKAELDDISGDNCYVWHKYPDVKPKEYKAYLVAYFLINKLVVTEATFDMVKNKWLPYTNDVLYWTEKPEPPELI